MKEQLVNDMEGCNHKWSEWHTLAGRAGSSFTGYTFPPELILRFCNLCLTAQAKTWVAKEKKDE